MSKNVNMVSSMIEKSAALYGPASMNATVNAGEIGADEIGKLVHFHWVQPITRIDMLVTGELREVYQRAHHDGAGSEHQVILMLTGMDDSVTGDKHEFEMVAENPVVLIAE